MNVVPVGLWKPIQQLQQDMNQVMQRFFGEPPDGPGQAGKPVWAPRVDIEEDDKQYVVRADLPGVDPKAVELSVVENTLVLRGEKKEEREEKGKNYHRIERMVGQFYREIPLPQGTEVDKVKATAANGVLTVTIPKAAATQPKKIPVEAQQA